MQVYARKTVLAHLRASKALVVTQSPQLKAATPARRRKHSVPCRRLAQRARSHWPGIRQLARLHGQSRAPARDFLARRLDTFPRQFSFVGESLRGTCDAILAQVDPSALQRLRALRVERLASHVHLLARFVVFRRLHRHRVLRRHGRCQLRAFRDERTEAVASLRRPLAEERDGLADGSQGDAHVGVGGGNRRGGEARAHRRCALA